ELTREVGNNCLVLPNELPGVVGVTAVGPSGELSFYSSYGAGVTDVTAPGGSSGQAPNPFGRVLAAWSSTGPPIDLPGRDVQDAGGAVYAWVQGTSMASPHAAGVAALIRAAHPNMSVGAVQATLQRTAMPKDCPTAAEMGPFPGGPGGEPGRADLHRRARQHQLLRQGSGRRARRRQRIRPNRRQGGPVHPAHPV